MPKSETRTVLVTGGSRADDDPASISNNDVTSLVQSRQVVVPELLLAIHGAAAEPAADVVSGLAAVRSQHRAALGRHGFECAPAVGLGARAVHVGDALALLAHGVDGAGHGVQVRADPARCDAPAPSTCDSRVGAASPVGIRGCSGRTGSATGTRRCRACRRGRGPSSRCVACPRSASDGAGRSRGPTPMKLVRDPVCGTHVAPRPSPSLAACTDPPCNATICRTMASPRPSPA